MATKRKADEEKLRRRRLARFRFRRLVHVVIFNRHWIAEIEDQDIGNNVHRNVAIIERRLTRKGTLTIIDKRILNSRPEERTEAHRRTLRSVLRTLECMRDFSKHQLDELAGCVAFQYLEPGRVILREGHEPVSVYFVADGEVTVSRRQWDWHQEAFRDVPCGTRTRGQMFGEITLLQQGIRRTATCTTATACELLWIGRCEFERILKDTLLERWRQLQLALERFDYFQYWTTDQFYEYCILSRIVSFEPQQKIPVDVDRSNAYFVLSGQCMILQCLTVARTVAGSYRLLPLQATAVGRVPAGGESAGASEHRFIDVGTLSCGAVFGLGEPLEHRMVVARTAVQCLTVPRDWLLAKRQNVGNTWERLRMRLEAAIPSRRQLFEQFVRDQRWRRYRKQLVNAFVRRNPRNDPAITRPTDVPIICRVEQGD